MGPRRAVVGVAGGGWVTGLTQFGAEGPITRLRRVVGMSVEDTIGYRQNIPACAVCGKNVTGGGGFARLNHNGRMLELCCPLCLQTFQTNPEPHLRRAE